MLSINQIESFYPDNLKPFKRNLLREYLQYKILEAVFTSKLANKLIFMGGTAIHIVHGNSRFSEDLDFDNRGLSRKAFEESAQVIARKLKLEGYNIELAYSFRGAFRAFVKVKDVLYENNLSTHKGEKLLIQIDAEPQEFTYAPEKVVINKFDIFTMINIVPAEILLSQKIYAILIRKRPMGRDFYDAIFLFGKTAPNFKYLQQKAHIKNMDELRTKLLARCGKLDFEHLAKDVSPYLFIPSDSQKVLLFKEYITGLKEKSL